MTEIWKTIPGYEGLYEVSDEGRIRSICGEGARKIGAKSCRIDGTGYVSTMLTDANGRPRSRRVHILVLEAFVCPRPEGRHASHLDGNRQNPKLANLIWETPKENYSRRIEHGTHFRGAGHPRATITEDDVHKIRALRAGGKTYPELSRIYGLNDEYLRKICIGERWRHIPLATQSPRPLSADKEGVKS